MNIATICFIFGAALLVVGIIGGGIEIKEFSIPKVSWLTRFISFVLGALLMVVGLQIDRTDKPSTSIQSNQSTELIACKISKYISSGTYEEHERPFCHTNEIKSKSQDEGNKFCRKRFDQLDYADFQNLGFNREEINHVWAHILNGDCVANTSKS